MQGLSLRKLSHDMLLKSQAKLGSSLNTAERMLSMLLMLYAQRSMVRMGTRFKMLLYSATPALPSGGAHM